MKKSSGGHHKPAAFKRIVLSLFIVFFIIAASLATLLFYFIHETSALSNEDFKAADANEGVLVEIENGMTSKSVAKLLFEKKLIKNANMFYAAARYPRLGAMAHCKKLTLEKGLYRIKSNMSVADIFDILSSGRTVAIKVTIPEGLTISKTAKRLEAAGVCDAPSFMAVCRAKDAASSRSLCGETLEGYLFPDTYFFEPGMAAGKAADVMVENFKAHIKTIDNLAAMDDNAFYQTLIIASIVEREYRAQDEAPIIAGVFMNRLRSNIGLYSCATVEYIITEIEGRPHPDVIKYEDLKSDSPYNTYKWAALPPAPISNPGMVALKAAASPADTPYYYFRLTDSEHGRHTFSKTFDKHVHEGSASKIAYKTKAEN